MTDESKASVTQVTHEEARAISRHWFDETSGNGAALLRYIDQQEAAERERAQIDAEAHDGWAIERDHVIAAERELASLRSQLTEALAAKGKAEAAIAQFHQIENVRAQEAEKRAETAERENERLKALYHELILEVGTAYPGESRHQTALRFIKQSEPLNRTGECGTAAAKCHQ